MGRGGASCVLEETQSKHQRWKTVTRVAAQHRHCGEEEHCHSSDEGGLALSTAMTHFEEKECHACARFRQAHTLPCKHQYDQHGSNYQAWTQSRALTRTPIAEMHMATAMCGRMPCTRTLCHALA
eukprot:2990741-Rhodomonas_salina.3